MCYKWLTYVQSLPARKLASDTVTLAARQLWEFVRTDAPEPPNTTPLEAGGMLLSWTYPEKYLDIEIHPDGSYELFFSSENENDGTPEDVTLSSNATPPRNLVAHIKTLAE